MSKTLQRAALLFAASDLNEAEIRRLLQILTRQPPAEFLRLIRRAREAVDREITGPGEGVSRSPQLRDRDEQSNNLVTQIEYLLRHDAGLSTAEAIKQLREVLSNDNIPSPRILSTPVRPTPAQFRRWIARLTEFVPASVLLHYATVIRNERTHLGASDWPLRDRE